MDLLWPNQKADLDTTELYELAERSVSSLQNPNLRPDADSPWIALNMISSLDGSATVSGLSGALGGEGDKQVFNSLRAAADFILVGSGTVRAEKYGQPKNSPEVVKRRLERGQKPAPQLAVISGRLSISKDDRFLKEASPENLPIIFTSSHAPKDKLEALSTLADIRVAGQKELDLKLVVSQLGGYEKVVLAEGGPTLNAQLVKDSLLDEVCLTIAPSLVSGTGPRILKSEIEVFEALNLKSVAVDKTGSLFLRYLRA